MAAGSDTTVACDSTAAACSVAAAACSVAAAECGVAAAECGVAAGCVTTTESTRTAGCGLAGDSRGTLEAAPEAAGDIAPAAFE